MDGIGGTAKRGGNNFFVPFFLFYLIPPSLPPGVMTKVLARKAIVKTAKDFAITGSAACPGIKFIYIGKAEVGVEDQGLGRVGLQWNQAAEGDPESPPHGGLDPNEIEFLLNLTNNLVRFLEKVQ